LLASAFDVDPEAVARNLGVAGTVTREVARAASSGSGWWVALTALVVLAWATRGVYRALAITFALAWERSATAAGTNPKGYGVFAAAVALQLGLVFVVGAIRHQWPIGGIAAMLVFAVAVGGIWLVVGRELPHRSTGWRALVPGAVLYGVGLFGVQGFNVYLLGRVIADRSSTYGTLGTAAAILLSLFLLGRVMVASAVLDATLFDRRAAAGRR
jgi:uncharacterized BrkB/YihY/UPF0761 family membrane protein